MASSRSRHGLALFAVVLLAPLAAAQGDDELAPPDDTPSLEELGLSETPPPPGTVLDIEEDGLTFQGRAESPSYVALAAPDGSPAFSFVVDEDGRARVDVAGQPLFADATFVRLEGNPLGESFTLVLQDGNGNVFPVSVDRAILAMAQELPAAEQVPPITVERPVGWPGAPTQVRLLYLADAADNRLRADDLDGDEWLQRDGTHRAVVQVPLAESRTWDRVALEARKTGAAPSLNASLPELRTTADATVFSGSFAPSLLGLADGDTVEVQIFFERRLAALVAERYAEPALHRYRVDGTGPSVSIKAPAESAAFSFPVTWNGADASTGIRGYQVDWRVAGSPQWTAWEKLSANSATFSGAWGTSYEFRVRAIDRAGNPSQYATATTRVAAQPAGSDDVNDPPTARFLTPRAGEVLSGVVSVTWEAADPDGTAVTSRLEVSEDDGRTWRLLYSGEGERASWSTADETEGPGYRLRLTVKDGSLSAADALSGLTVRNLVASETPPAPSAPGAPPAPASPAAPPAAPAAPGAGPDAEGEPVDAAEADARSKETPAPFVGLALLVAALLAARRRA